MVQVEQPKLSVKKVKLPKVAFIIVSWNNRDLLSECFDSIKSQNYANIDIYLVDNGSKDGSVQYIKKNYPEVKLIEEKQNQGFAKGNNIAIREGMKDKQVKYFALLNTDARVGKNWTRSLVEFAESRPNIALMQGLTLDYYDHQVIDSMHIYIDKNGSAVQYGWRKKRDLEILHARKVMGVNAAAALYSRNFLEAQPFSDQYFDEDLFMYLEDVDISLRATIMGWDNYFVPKAVAYHMGSVSSDKKPDFSIYMTFRNNIPVLVKNMPLRLLIKFVLSMPLHDYRYRKELRKRGQFTAAKKLTKARFASFPLIVKLLHKRRILNKSGKHISYDYLNYLMISGKQQS